MASKKQAAWHPEGAAHRQDAGGPAGPKQSTSHHARRFRNPIASGSRLLFDRPLAACSPCFRPAQLSLWKNPILALKKSYGMPMRGRTAGSVASGLGTNRRLPATSGLPYSLTVDADTGTSGNSRRLHMLNRLRTPFSGHGALLLASGVAGRLPRPQCRETSGCSFGRYQTPLR